MPLSPGTRIGPYEIVSPLGAGGMGDVYRATDNNLGRQVALKVLPPAFASDRERMVRFRREAQVLASLNHPNIATIHGIEENAIVMELVDGHDLAGPLPVGEALVIAKQIAEALEAAHEKGVTHRDLKPANIRITPQGVVKLLDFGLAKPAESEPTVSSANSPTLTAGMTGVGMILGTAAYMAPEQARGKVVDRRADIWAFGVVVLEMLTGKQTYTGETVADTLAAVITRDSPHHTLPPETPPFLRALLARCAEKDPKRRLQWIGEARVAIEDYLANPTATPETPAATPRPMKNNWLPWAVAAASIVASVGGGLYFASRPAPLRPLVRLNVELDPDAPLSDSINDVPLAISPDGTRIAALLRSPDGNNRIYTRLLQQAALQPLAGTENASFPFFSPDGQWIGFAAEAKLKKISVGGGAAITLCALSLARGASWADDGNIFFTGGQTQGLWRVPASGGKPEFAPAKDGVVGRFALPQVLPGSQAAIVTDLEAGSFNNDAASVEAVSLRTGERKVLVRGGFAGRVLITSHGAAYLVFLRGSTLFAARFDLKNLALTGEPVPVLEEVRSGARSTGHFAFSRTGIFLFRTGREERSKSVISRIDPSGKTQPLLAKVGRYQSIRFSPDGKRLAFSQAGNEGSDIWVKDLDRDGPSRLTFLKGANTYPVWTPDGKSIVFRSSEPEAPGLYWIRADGSGEAQRLSDDKIRPFADSISPDGKTLVMEVIGNAGSWDLVSAPFEGDAGHPKLGKVSPFLATPYTEVSARFSPDGRWLAFQSSESGTMEVYVRPFPGPGGRWQVSAGGGNLPSWSGDGRKLYYSNQKGRVMVGKVDATKDSIVLGKPEEWFISESSIIRSQSSGWDVARDGKSLAMIHSETTETERAETHLVLLQNFLDELERKVSPEKGR